MASLSETTILLTFYAHDIHVNRRILQQHIKEGGNYDDDKT